MNKQDQEILRRAHILVADMDPSYKEGGAFSSDGVHPLTRIEVLDIAMLGTLAIQRAQQKQRL